jgi:hypothetical protein
MIVELTLRDGEQVTVGSCVFERDRSGRYACGDTPAGRVRLDLSKCRRQVLLSDEHGLTAAGRRAKAADERSRKQNGSEVTPGPVRPAEAHTSPRRLPSDSRAC